jgi:hypothetical protein
MLKLIKAWLRAPIVEEEEGKGRSVKANLCGTPQGGVISPLLANIYLHPLDEGVNDQCQQKPRMIRYADDRVPRAQGTKGPKECATAQPMREGPSEPAYRSRIQTAFGGHEQKSWS